MSNAVTKLYADTKRRPILLQIYSYVCVFFVTKIECFSTFYIYLDIFCANLFLEYKEFVSLNVNTIRSFLNLFELKQCQIGIVDSSDTFHMLSV